MIMRRQRVLSKLSSTRKSIARNIAAWKTRGLGLASSWKKSITASACIRRSVIVRRWSSSASLGTLQLRGEGRHEFSEAWGIYRSDEACATGSERFSSPPVLIGFDEFQPAIPWQVALQQSLPPLRRLRAILKNQTSPYNDFSANGYNPLNFASHPKGAFHKRHPLPLAHPHPGFKSGTFYFAEKRKFLFCVDIVDGVDGVGVETRRWC